MAKKRKTKKQKKLADSRHIFTHSNINPVISEAKIEYKTESIVKPQIKNPIAPIDAYPYLAKDLSKTAILTIGILVFQIVLFSLLTNHVLTIPGLSY